MLQSQIIIINRYQLQHLLRRGGMSEVYLAYDIEMQREVAIKLASSDNPDCFKRLQREVRMLSALAHPHILPTLDQGGYEGWHYLVMPYMRRGTLREHIASGRLTLEEAGQVLEQVADALQFAHDHGVVHRDIKPSNILLDNENEHLFYLADFGLAKMIEEGSDITQTGCLVGTPEYMAPELTEKPESASSDIYALGILLYQMLAGQLPFKGSTPLSIYWKHLHEQPVPPSHLNPVIPYPVERVILHALEKNPRNRFRTAREMAQAYKQALALVEATDGEGLYDVSQGLTPVYVEVKKTSEVKLPLTRTAPGKQGWWRKVQMGFVACIAVLMLFVTPLSLGVMMARDGMTSTLIAGASANFAATSLRPVHPDQSTPTPAPVKTATPPSYHSDTGAYEPPEQRLPTHKHGHGHGHNNNKVGRVGARSFVTALIRQMNRLTSIS